jgi:hypothetical protein
LGSRASLSSAHQILEREDVLVGGLLPRERALQQLLELLGAQPAVARSVFAHTSVGGSLASAGALTEAGYIC